MYNPEIQPVPILGRVNIQPGNNVELLLRLAQLENSNTELENKLAELINDLEERITYKVENVQGEYTKTKKALKAVEGLLKAEIQITNQNLSDNFEAYKTHIGESYLNLRSELIGKVSTVHNNHIDLASRIGRTLNDLDFRVTSTLAAVNSITVNTLIANFFNTIFNHVKNKLNLLRKVNNTHEG
jgi:hypothetical protein